VERGGGKKGIEEEKESGRREGKEGMG